jgi:hypothetical protein
MVLPRSYPEENIGPYGAADWPLPRLEFEPNASHIQGAQLCTAMAYFPSVQFLFRCLFNDAFTISRSCSVGWYDR